ncbi:MAG: VIT1/CCC1 transporter family protein [Candidatus Margulisiibacteriota bacterium]|nr:VIT1/CCC1 transporter family protein [Candidatus Margulisiibacteriota bacterium]
MATTNETTKNKLLSFQKNEITEHFIYKKLARIEKGGHNKDVLRKISKDELRHYNIWRKYSGDDVRPDKIKVAWYLFIARVFGVTFGIKLMEAGEEKAQDAYLKVVQDIPEAAGIKNEEEQHENELIEMIDEEKLKYIGSIVLGLNDALVELTGTLAGLTFALQNARLVGVAGLITGIAASLSMAASEYLSTKTEGGEKDPLKASFYTGAAYVAAVTVLITPFLALNNPFLSLLLALIGAVFLILVFTFYFSVVKGVPFKKRFLEMIAVSLGVASLSFIIGLAVRYFLGIDI